MFKQFKITVHNSSKYSRVAKSLFQGVKHLIVNVQKNITVIREKNEQKACRK
jgi:hypothetical protein